MILAHLSDLHLGFRAWDRAEGGRNVRERDVAASFERSVQHLVEAAPGLIVITGDVFDRPDPTPGALVALTRGLAELRAELPGAPVVLVAGARDTPPLGDEPGVLSVVAELPGVHVASGSMRCLSLLDGLVHACLIPGRALLEGPRPDPGPDPAARWNVLALHGSVGADIPGGPGLIVETRSWSYVAMGGQHRHQAVEANALFSGSLERVGREPWREAAVEKGFVLWNLERGRGTFHPVPGRPVVALAPIRVPEDPDGIRRRVKEVVDEVPGGIDDKIVHVTLRGVPPPTITALQGGPLAELRRRALHVMVEVEDPAPGRAPDARALPAPADLPGPLSGMELPAGLVAVVAALPDLSDGLPDPATALHEGVRRLVGAWGGGRLERALRSHGGPGPAGDPPPHLRMAPEERNQRIRAMASAPEELRQAELDLRRLRADHAELTGDLEESTMEWLRERQDAETQLQAYRDRARELKARLTHLETSGAGVDCPTCGRTLGDHFEIVVAELREEWESVVQDGRWWKRRREQLDLKPEGLQAVESRNIRLQAAMEAQAEQVERARITVRELDELRGGTRPAAEPEDLERMDGQMPPTHAGSPFLDGRGEARLGSIRETLATLRHRAAERLLDRATGLVNRLSAGRVIALTGDELGGVHLQGWEALLPRPRPEDLAAATVALELAGALCLADAEADGGVRDGAQAEAEGGAGARSPGGTQVVVAGAFDQLGEEDRLLCVDLLVDATDRIGRVIVATGSDIVDRRPEAFDAVVSLDPSGGEPRALPCGLGVVRLR